MLMRIRSVWLLVEGAVTPNGPNALEQSRSKKWAKEALSIKLA
jgi:hypothetical protein